jgi:hypothetical protein
MNDVNEKTNPLSHEAVSQALETLFVEEDRDKAFQEVPAWQVHQHLADCEDCRRQFDAVALADRSLACPDKSDSAQLCDRQTNGFERNFGEASFMGALDQMLDAEHTRSDEAPEDNLVELSDQRANEPKRHKLRNFGIAAAVLLIGGASWFAFNQTHKGVAGGDNPASPSQFQSRSAAATNTYGALDKPEMEVFCAEHTPDGVQFTGTKDAPFGLLACPLDAEIKLAYSNSSSKLQYAAFFGVDQQGKIYWYGPTPADTGAVEVEKTSQMLPFGDTIRLGVNHEPGQVRVFGLFSPEPVDFVTLRQTVDDVDRRRLFDGEKPGQMALHGVLTSSSFEVSDGGKR